MTLISSQIGLFENKGSDEPCDVCFKTKQTQLPFPLSNSKATNCFDLIHCDTWGGYKVESLCGAHYFLTIIDAVSYTHLTLPTKRIV